MSSSKALLARRPWLWSILHCAQYPCDEFTMRVSADLGRKAGPLQNAPGTELMPFLTNSSINPTVSSLANDQTIHLYSQIGSHTDRPFVPHPRSLSCRQQKPSALAKADSSQ